MHQHVSRDSRAARNCQRSRDHERTGKRTWPSNVAARPLRRLIHKRVKIRKANLQRSERLSFARQKMFGNSKSSMPEYNFGRATRSSFIIKHSGTAKAVWDWFVVFVTFYVTAVVPYYAAVQVRSECGSGYWKVIGLLKGRCWRSINKEVEIFCEFCAFRSFCAVRHWTAVKEPRQLRATRCSWPSKCVLKKCNFDFSVKMWS